MGLAKWMKYRRGRRGRLGGCLPHSTFFLNGRLPYLRHRFKTSELQALPANVPLRVFLFLAESSCTREAKTEWLCGVESALLPPLSKRLHCSRYSHPSQRVFLLYAPEPKAFGAFF